MPSEWAKEDLNTLYATAHQFYESGDFKKASDVFKVLAKADPFDDLYWRGLASSLQMQKRFSEALHAWGVVAILREKDPWVHFHAAECMISQGETKEAAKALRLAEANCQTHDLDLKNKVGLLKTLYTT